MALASATAVFFFFWLNQMETSHRQLGLSQNNLSTVTPNSFTGLSSLTYVHAASAVGREVS